MFDILCDQVNTREGFFLTGTKINRVNGVETRRARVTSPINEFHEFHENVSSRGFIGWLTMLHVTVATRLNLTARV